MKGEVGRKRLREAVDITQPPHSDKHPIVKAIYEGKAQVTTPFDRNYVVSGDLSQFVAPERLDFQLKEGSKVYTDVKGFKPIPFEKIGLYVDAYRRSLPVAGAR